MKKDKKILNNIIYQAPSGAIEFKGDFNKETIWANLEQIASLFNRDKSVISRHIKNIFKEGELKKDSVVAFFATTASDRKIYQVEYFNLDVLISVGYRVNSVMATRFRKWATRVLGDHLIKGYTIDRNRINKNYKDFLQAVDFVQKLLPETTVIKPKDSLELIKLFAHTWFSLDAYDKTSLPKVGVNKKQIKITAKELREAIMLLRQDLINRKEASNFFAIEKQKDAIEGVVGNIFQTVNKKEVYLTLEEKAAHLLYFLVKDHLFIDGNKRSGAFAFVWFLGKAGLLNKNFSSSMLTALTLLVAESAAKSN